MILVDNLFPSSLNHFYRLLKGVLFASLFGVFCSCNSSHLQEYRGEAQGTYYAIKYLSETAKPPLNKFYFDSLFKSIDSSLSNYNNYSTVSQYNQSDSIVTSDPWFIQMIRQSQKVYVESNGYFDPSVVHLVKAWGFGPEGRQMKAGLSMDSLMALTGWENVVSTMDEAGHLHLRKKIPEIQIGFNAIAQGYTADIIAQKMEEKGIKNYLIDAGGELLAKGVNQHGKTWSIGIDKPVALNDARELVAILPLKNKAIATSGSYRKFYEIDGVRYSHAISPKTGQPVKHTLLSVTVIADSCALADAYSTAILVMGLEKGKDFLENHPELQAYLVYGDQSGGFQTYVTPKLEKVIEKIE